MLSFGIRGILRQINDNLKHIRDSQTRMEIQMSQMDDEIAQVVSDVAGMRTVVDSAVAAFQGVAARIQAAIDEARAAGATPQQLQSMTDLHAAVSTQSTDLAQAVASQAPSATGGTSGGSTGGSTGGTDTGGTAPSNPAGRRG